MNIKKRILSLILALATLLPMALYLTSCDSGSTTTPPTTDEGYETEPPESTESPTTVPESTFVDMTEKDPKIEITEIMYANFVTISDLDGNYTPWIEIYNKSADSVSLCEYTLEYKNSQGIKTSITLPEITLSPKEYKVLFLNGKEGENSISVNADVSGEITILHGEYITQNVVYTNRTKNYSFVTENGSETMYPTPGYMGVRIKDNLYISEIMSTNSLYLVKGASCDWIEIYNATSSELDLSKFFISTDKEDPFNTRLPDVKVPAGEYYLIACEKDVPFKLSKDGESVFITRNDGVLISSVTFQAMEQNTSWTHDKGVVNYPTPGLANTEVNSTMIIAQRKGLVISEVISSNSKYKPLNKKYYDIVELYNNSDESINLSEYYFSDSGNELQRYQLPEVTLGAGEYYLVYCDKTAKDTAPISISSSGEKLYISKADGTLSDAILIPEIPVNRSWGRTGKQLVYFATPTLGKANGTGYPTVTKAPVASLESGVYNSSQAVFLTYEGTVYYTLDGSEPTQDSKIYTGEIIPVDKTMAIRAVAYNGSMIPSEVVTFNYLIDIPDYSLPVIKLSMSDEQMFGANGIYTKYTSGKEIKGNIAFFLDGNEEFSINCGIKIFGAYSRQFAKKSLQIEFRKEYGTARLEYPIFGDDGLSSFSNIVLRSGSQASYLTDSMFTDEFLTSLASTSGNMPNLMVQDYRPCNLYLNGEYYGVYFIREKIDDDFIADNLGVSEESVTIIDGYNTLKYGSSYQGWDVIWKKIYTNKIDFSKDDNYKWLADQINLESYADLIIMRAYSGDLDAGNIRFFKSEEYDEGRWNFILFDNDISFRSNSAAKTRLQRFASHSDYKKIHALFRALIQNEQFKAFFLERLAFHLNNTLSPQYVGAHLDKIVAQMEGDMPYQVDRWKHITDFYLPNMKRWYSNIDYMRSLTTDTRIGWFVNDAVKAFKLSKADVEKYMGEEFLKYL